MYDMLIACKELHWPKSMSIIVIIIITATTIMITTRIIMITSTMALHSRSRGDGRSVQAWARASAT